MASLPPSCAHGGRIAPSRVLPAAYGYWSAVMRRPSACAAAMARTTASAFPQLRRPASFRCEMWTAHPESRATRTISATASSMRSLSLRMWTTRGRWPAASTCPSAISSSVSA